MTLEALRNGPSFQNSDLTATEETTVTHGTGKVVTTKTIYITNSEDSEGVNTIQRIYSDQSSKSTSDDSDINFITRDSKRRSLNKDAYLKLHRSVTNRRSIELLKGKYEPSLTISEKGVNSQEIDENKNNIGKRDSGVDKNVDISNVIQKTTNNIEALQSKLSPKLSRDTVESLKIKYSPSSFGYTDAGSVKLREKPPIPEKPKRIPPKPPIRTSVLSSGSNRVSRVSQDLDTKPGHVVVLQSSSEDSIDKLETFMSEFTMEPKREVKEKKRTSSFRKILTGGIFSKDRKKSNKKDEGEKNKSKKTENVVVADNVQNEQMFTRNSTHRHTVDSHLKKPSKKPSPELNTKKQYIDVTTNNLNDIERRYAEMHINQFNKIKATFANPENFNNHNHSTETYQYLRENDTVGSSIDKYIDTTSSSSNTLESLDRNTYQNALIAQAELKQLREKEIREKQKENALSRHVDNSKAQESILDTPPRAKERYQNVQLVKPKALIPINSERALPNPYHNGQDGTQVDGAKKPTDKNLNSDEKDYISKIPVYNRQNDFNDSYEYTSIKVPSTQEQRQYSPNLTKSSNSSNQNSPTSPSFSARSSPRSPTLESSKLRLPSNRERVNLQPRIKSPIPQPKISTEKIIATELLKNKPEAKKYDKLPSPSHKMDTDYTDNSIYELKPVNVEIVRHSPVQNLVSKPPEIRSATDAFEAAKWHQRQRELTASPPFNDQSHVVGDVMVHVDPEFKRNSLQYASLPIAMRKANQEAVNMRQRPGTPVRRIPSTASLQQSPQKHEIRQSVELYCWKEIQKLKEKQDQELKYQLQYTPYGYVEDPIIQRRSRSVEPNQQRNTRRSTSLPREVKPPVNSRNYHREAIPENLPVIYKENDIYAQKNPNFVRSSPQRRTVSGTTQISPQTYDGYYSNSGEVTYRPIFNRGSLSPQAQAEAQNNLQKKVSFTGNRNPAHQQSWPTRNGYVQSPPQRRLDKTMSVGDDEVFIRDSQIKQMNEQIQQRMVKEAQYSPRNSSGSIMSLSRQQIINESPYETRPNQIYSQNNRIYMPRSPEQIPNEPIYTGRQNKQNVNELTKQKQENLQNIYGTRQQPNIDPIYVRQNYQIRSPQQVQEIKDNSSIISEPIYGARQQIVGERYYANNNVVAESPYGNGRVLNANPNVTKITKQVTVTNKVCDIYGKIHDNGQTMPISPTSPGQIQQTGVIYGQLQGNVLGRPPQYQSYNQISANFVRGTRLTASANDMYKRYPNDPRYREIVYEEGPYSQQRGVNFNPNAPLPPTPNEGKLQFLIMKKNNAYRNYPQISDTESDTSEVRKIMNRNYMGGRQPVNKKE